MAKIKEVTITKTIKKCVDEECAWRSDKYETGCGKFIDLQTCIDRNGKMTREEAIKKGLL